LLGAGAMFVWEALREAGISYLPNESTVSAAFVIMRAALISVAVGA